MNTITTIQGSWSDETNGWESETLQLTGDTFLEIELPHKGRVVIKKAEQVDGPYTKALITKWCGPSFIIKLYGGSTLRYIKIITTETPNTIQYANI